MKLLKRLLIAVPLLAIPVAALADNYPAKPIRLVVPFPPGGGTDILSRLVGTQLGDVLKTADVVENKPGAGGNIGVDVAAKSPHDGYTLVMGQTSNLAINPSLYRKLPYDPVRDLSPAPSSRLPRSCWSSLPAPPIKTSHRSWPPPGPIRAS